MKLVSTSFGRLGEKLSSLLLGCFLALPLVASAQDAVYTSPAFVSVPPNVNATNFINAGVWNIRTPGIFIPYQTFSTLNYTNTGTMGCSVGWQFDCGPYPSGPRRWSANFFNDTYNPATGNGLISATDGAYLTFLNNGVLTALNNVSRFFISATNIVNKGLLAAGPNGLMVLNGSGVNLNHSGLEITPLVGRGSVNDPTNFAPDVAIYDEFWVGGTNRLTMAGPIWNGTAIGQAYFLNAGIPCGTANEFIGPLVPQAVDSYTNNFGLSLLVTTNNDTLTTVTNVVYSNIVHQAVFAYVSDAAIIPSVRFGPRFSATNIFLPMAAQFITYATNIVTGTLQPSTIYVADNLAANGTNGNLLLNTFFNPGAACTAPTYKPDSVDVSRIDSTGYYGNGQNYYGPPSDTFFYDPLTYSNYVSVGRATLIPPSWTIWRRSRRRDSPSPTRRGGLKFCQGFESFQSAD